MAEKCRFPHLSEPHNVTRLHPTQPFRCEVCQVWSEQCPEYYHCPTCNKDCHIGCFKFPPEITKHPYHDPSHILKITSSDSNPSIPNSSSDHKVITSSPDENLGQCKCCRRKLQDMYYHCSICKFSLNATCAIEPPPPLTIVSPKIHAQEIFTLFPRRISLPCDACGLLLNDGNDHAYTCLSRNYIAHGKCILELPYEIWITRHSHRLSHTHSLTLQDALISLPCGVCYKTVKVNYGHYSCTKEGCHYAVHSKCATRNDVWDGKELKGVPQEEESEEDIEPFEWIDKETLHHFSHEHYLKFYGENNDLHDDGSKFCQACLLLIIESDSLFSCMQCDFILHKSCASLPRKIGHQLHKHRLTLLPVPTNLYLIQFTVFVEGIFKCSGCHQRGYGFMYKCNEEGCKFQVDARCASLAQLFIHGSHHHPLFLSLRKGECMRCGSNHCSPFYLECSSSGECNFVLGLKCATLPSVAYYKYDSHGLDLCYGEKNTTSLLQYWCEICESKLDASEWFYTCDKCKVTLHVSCLLGKEVHMKPHHVIKINGKKVEIVGNKGNCRPFCGKCGDRCVDALVFKCLELDRYFCTLRCMQKSLDRERREEEQKEAEEGAIIMDLP